MDTINNSLTMDFDNLRVMTDFVSVEWAAVNICSEHFELQGFNWSFNTALNGTVEYVKNTTLFRANISSNRLAKGDLPVVYRIVAVDDGNICSRTETRISYYRFNGIHYYKLDLPVDTLPVWVLNHSQLNLSPVEPPPPPRSPRRIFP